MHVLDDLMVGALHKVAKPGIYLFFDCLTGELVAFQTFAIASRGVSMASRCVPHA